MDQAAKSARRDAVHGGIDFYSQGLLDDTALIEEVLKSAPLRRLATVKQLPFANTEFLSADHTRYAHALGSGYMMLCMLRRLRERNYFDSNRLSQLDAIKEECGGRTQPTLSYFGNHLVLAALLQDLGELPYKTATDLFLFPDHSLREALADEFGSQAFRLSGKDVFTLHAVRHVLDEASEAKGRVSFDLLAYLIAGVDPFAFKVPDVLAELRHLVDGPVDADRLDYVHRDCYHTLGSVTGSAANSVISSLKSLSADGPVFDSPGPVSNFVVLRALLRFQVYSSPQARFSYTLMARVLSEAIGRSPVDVSASLGAPRGALSFQSFLSLNDATFLARLEQLNDDSSGATLSVTSRDAIGILRNRSHEYRHYWLDEPGLGRRRSHERLPANVLVDTYWDEERHRLHQPNSIFIDEGSYALGHSLVPLEATGGHVSEMLQTIWDSPPVADKLLLFVPDARGRWLDSVTRDEEARAALYASALDRDAEVRLGVSDDTRDTPGYSGPVIFVSFSWSQINLTRVVLRLLHERKRRYLAFVDDFHGLASDTRENGQQAASSADAALIVLSHEYILAACDPSSNIYAELVGLAQSAKKRVVLLSADEGTEFSSELQRFPWRLLGLSASPFLGRALPPSNVFLVERAVEEALRQIDDTAD